jgi:hypothetical protein
MTPKFAKTSPFFAGLEPRIDTNEHKLKEQLTTPTYEFRNGKILIESKADIKKRLGCKALPLPRASTRRGRGFIADAYVNGLYALQFVENQLLGGRDVYDDFEDLPYCGGYSAMGM